VPVSLQADPIGMSCPLRMGAAALRNELALGPMERALQNDHAPLRRSHALADISVRVQPSRYDVRRRTAAKHMAELQHNMWVANVRSAELSVITGRGKWVEIPVHADQS
jgi:hypothetical protein